jgi:NAD(P)-dependent dehydrogenase (short-subunit alcohol dehydrogenase family)
LTYDYVIATGATHAVEDFDAIMTLNMRSAFFVVRAVVKRLLSAKMTIVNISSQGTSAAQGDHLLHRQRAIEEFTRAMAIEFAPRGIRVNAQCPTFKEMPMTKSFFENAEFKADVPSRIKFGRLGTVEDLMARCQRSVGPNDRFVADRQRRVDRGIVGRSCKAGLCRNDELTSPIR